MIKIFILWIFTTHVPCDTGQCQVGMHDSSKNYGTMAECQAAKTKMLTMFKRDGWRKVSAECTEATLPFLEPAPLAEK